MTEGYEVGHSKPPKETRWKKGQSGNPSGKRKKTIASHLDVARFLSKPATAILPSGKKTEMDMMEAGYFNMCKKALEGDKNSLFNAMKIMLSTLPLIEDNDQELEKLARESEESNAEIFKFMMEMEAESLARKKEQE